jgi:hypothetical protein
MDVAGLIQRYSLGNPLGEHFQWGTTHIFDLHTTREIDASLDVQ